MIAVLLINALAEAFQDLEVVVKLKGLAVGGDETVPARVGGLAATN
ncbi:hypothetical protein [Roseibium sp. RKSG952]|nr:hypothetical protein [Roseibium sp. RKSG952]